MYIVCIMSFVWRTGTTDDAGRGLMSPEDAFAFRVIVSVVLSLGLLYFVLIASTLRKYGEMMDQAWHRRIIGWVNDTVATATHGAAGSGYLPQGRLARTPILYTTNEVPFNSQPAADSGLSPKFNPYSTDGPRQELKGSSSCSVNETASSARSHIRLHSDSLLPSAEPHAESSVSNIYDSDNRPHAMISQPVSTDENLTRDLKILSTNAPPPPPTSSPLSALVPINSLPSSEAIPDNVHHKGVIDRNIPQEPIKLARLLLLSYEGDHPLDVPPSEDELKACNMTKELWTELQTVGATFVNDLFVI